MLSISLFISWNLVKKSIEHFLTNKDFGFCYAVFVTEFGFLQCPIPHAISTLLWPTSQHSKNIFLAVFSFE